MPSRRTVLGLAAALPALTWLPKAARAGSPRIFAAHGLAIAGADPVAYFQHGRAVAGSAAHPLLWNGATWLFATPANRTRFEADPRAFAPRYGGYCAWGVGRGYLASIDPEAFTIHGGRLYLNYSKGIRRRFRHDIEANIARADANWPGVLDG